MGNLIENSPKAKKLALITYEDYSRLLYCIGYTIASYEDKNKNASEFKQLLATLTGKIVVNRALLPTSLQHITDDEIVELFKIFEESTQATKDMAAHVQEYVGGKAVLNTQEEYE